MRLTSVDFPEPVVPRIATVCPGLAVKETPLRMSRVPPGYRNETLSKSTLQESGRRIEASGASFTSSGASRTSKTLWDEAPAREMLAERKPMVRIGKSIKPSRVLKATRSPTDNLPTAKPDDRERPQVGEQKHEWEVVREHPHGGEVLLQQLVVDRCVAGRLVVLAGEGPDHTHPQKVLLQHGV